MKSVALLTICGISSKKAWIKSSSNSGNSKKGNSSWARILMLCNSPAFVFNQRGLKTVLQQSRTCMNLNKSPAGSLNCLLKQSIPANAIGIIDEEGNFPRSRQAFAVDAISTMVGSLFGLSPVTSYIESGAGVEAGSKTGLTAVICAFYFLLSIFFAPVIASIPPWATGGALIIVGSLMARSLNKVKWENPSHAISAFVTLIIMPLTYSIAYGLIAGIGSYVIMESVFALLSLVGIAKPFECSSADNEEESVMEEPKSMKEEEAPSKDEEDMDDDVEA